jgi:hypothetical protein
VGLIHNGRGRLMPLTPEQQRVYGEITSLTAPFYTVQNQNDFQRNLAFGRPNDWQCSRRPLSLHLRGRPGAWCSQQRGHPGITLAEYRRGRAARGTSEELRAALHRLMRAPRGCSTAFARSQSRRSTK